MTRAGTAADARRIQESRILSQIAELRELDTDSLRERWRILSTGKPPPTRQALLQRLIYRVQEIAFGGIAPGTRERLKAIADADEGKANGSNNVESPVAGTVYRRLWRGEEIVVMATPNGFECRGRQYASLTAVARAVTGQHLNGKLFFGVTKRERRKGGRT